jgi:predicted RNase H-like HicB family nuclease
LKNLNIIVGTLQNRDKIYEVTLRAGPLHGYEADCSDFPGCRITATTEQEAIQKIKEAIAFYLESCPCDQIRPENLPIKVHKIERKI